MNDRNYNATKILRAWRANPESALFPMPDFIRNFEEKPDCFAIGSNTTGELFAIIRMPDGQSLDLDDFPSRWLKEFRAIDVPLPAEVVE